MTAVSMTSTLLVMGVLSLSGCATAILERPNPAGGPPLTTFLISSNAEEIRCKTASGALLTIRKIDNSSGVKEAIRVWSMFNIWRRITGLAGGLAGSAIDKAAGGQ